MERNENIGGFDVSVNNPLLVGVLHCLANGNKQIKSVLCTELHPVAVFGDWHSAYQFHYQIRQLSVRRSSVEDTCNVGMIHQRERLPLEFETSNNLTAIHAGFYDLQSYFSSYWLELLSHINNPHAAFANLFQQLVSVDERTDHRVVL